MDLSSPLSQETLDHLLAGVEKPGRYVGGEPGSITHEEPTRCRMALCFPDIYEVAESHVGFKILYEIINRTEGYAAERVYALWPDLEARVEEAKVALWSLETLRPLHTFDVVGFTLQFELAYPTVIAMLELGGIPPRSDHRSPSDPVVIGGGIGTYNPEPIAPFFDAFLLGDGEPAVLELMEAVEKTRHQARAEVLESLGRIDGVYVPSHYEVEYEGLAVQSIRALPNTPKADLTTQHKTPRVSRVTVADLEAAIYPTAGILPNVPPIHERAAVEIQRGCSRGCRFCQAGMATRPTRQRSPQKVVDLSEASLASSGFDEVGLLSLSAGDYGPLDRVVESLFSSFPPDQVSVSLPSLRPETMTPALAERLARGRKSGFTFAPEAGTERLRRVIGKTNTEADLLNAVRAAVRVGWKHLKFYFMVGLPTETDEDIDAIATLAEGARDAARAIRDNATVTVSLSTFIPKSHTPFQWEKQANRRETEDKQNRLKRLLRTRRISFRYHASEQSFVEGVLARGDRRLAPAMERLAREGCRLDAWTEHHDHGRWVATLTETLAPFGLGPDDFLAERSEDALLPWDHLDAGILKDFLRRDRHRARAAESLGDCAFGEDCYACGGCDLANPYLPRGERGERPVALRPLTCAPDASILPAGREARATESPGKGKVARSRVRFRYAKTGRAIHLSHLDTKAQLLRAIRLSRLPVLYTQGYSPRPRVGFSPACPTGMVSTAEFFEADCDGFPDPEATAPHIDRHLPEGLEILEGTEVDCRAPSLNDLLLSISYAAGRPSHLSAADLSARVERFRARERHLVRVLRKKKQRVMDVRSQVVELGIVDDELRFRIAFGESGTIKVSEALAAILGPDQIPSLRIRKTEMELAAEKPTRPDTRVKDPDGPVLDLTAVSQRHTLSRREQA